MYRKTIDELIGMLESYKDILSKGFFKEVKLYRNNLNELKKIIDKEYEKVSADSFSPQMFEYHRERRRLLVKILYATQTKIFYERMQT